MKHLAGNLAFNVFMDFILYLLHRQILLIYILLANIGQRVKLIYLNITLQVNSRIS